jgi:hypothetical protein
MFENLIHADFIGAICGITVIAFKDPEIYRTLNKYVLIGIFISILLGAAYNLGIQIGMFLVIQTGFVNPDHARTILLWLREKQLDLLYLAGAIGLFVYVDFLRTFPAWLRKGGASRGATLRRMA